MDKSREQFERLAAKEGLSLEVFNGDYNWKALGTLPMRWLGLNRTL